MWSPPKRTTDRPLWTTLSACLTRPPPCAWKCVCVCLNFTNSVQTVSHWLPFGHTVAYVRICVPTYKWEREVTSVKMPSGSSETSLPWRDLRSDGERKWQRRKISTHTYFIVREEKTLWVSRLTENSIATVFIANKSSESHSKQKKQNVCSFQLECEDFLFSPDTLLNIFGFWIKMSNFKMLLWETDQHFFPTLYNLNVESNNQPIYLSWKINDSFSPRRYSLFFRQLKPGKTGKLQRSISVLCWHSKWVVGGLYFWLSLVQLAKMWGSVGLENAGVKFLCVSGWQGQQGYRGWGAGDGGRCVCADEQVYLRACICT